MKDLNKIEYTTKQLTEIYGVAHMTVWRWRQQGMPFIKRGKRVTFVLEDVKKWLDEQGYKMSLRK